MHVCVLVCACVRVCVCERGRVEEYMLSKRLHGQVVSETWVSVVLTFGTRETGCSFWSHSHTGKRSTTPMRARMKSCTTPALLTTLPVSVQDLLTTSVPNTNASILYKHTHTHTHTHTRVCVCITSTRKEIMYILYMLRSESSVSLAGFILKRCRSNHL